MTYIPGFPQQIPFNAVYYANPHEVSPSEYPNIYTSDGPLPTANGIGFDSDSIVFMPSAVTSGTFDCGTFSSPS